MHLVKSSLVRLCGVAAALFLFGCGSSSSSGDPAAAFAGNWTFGSGSLQPMCGGLGSTLTPVDLTGDTMTIVRVDPTHVSTSLTGSGVMCNVNFTVSGMIATAETAGSTCAVTVPVGTSSTTVAISITSWTLNVSGDTLSMSMSGSANATIFTCTPTADGNATRPPAG